MARAGLAVACVLLVAAAGCGGSNVAEGATVTVYTSAPLCAGAKRELARSGDRAGSVRVTVICAPSVEASGRLSLATVGANARRAVEDSRTIAYLEPPGRASRFARPILEEAEIALITDGSGEHGMASVLAALGSRGDQSPRESVWEGRSPTEDPRAPGRSP